MGKVYVDMCVSLLSNPMFEHNLVPPHNISANDGCRSLVNRNAKSPNSTLSLNLKAQTTCRGSGLSKQMNCWRARRRRVERRAPALLSGSDVRFGCSRCVSKEFKLCFYSLPVGRSSHFLFMPHSEKKKKLRKTMSAHFLTPQSYNLQPRSAVRCACAVFNIYSIWFHLFLRL